MKFTDIFIRRPVLATVVSLFLFILGLKSLFDLDVRQYPVAENTVITIQTAYPGASAELIQGFITHPLQTAIAAADGIDYLTSTNTQGVSTIQAKLRLNFNSSQAFTDILAKVNSVTNQLPKDAQLPVLKKTTGSSVSLLYINYASDKMSSSQIYDYLVRVIQPKLQSVPGVSSADILGGNPFAMRIWLNPSAMAGLSVTTADINSALVNNNYLSAAGQFRGSYTLTNINAHTDLHTVDDFKNIVIRESQNRLIHLGDVARVELGAENYSSSVAFNGKRGVFVGINALPSANPLTVIKEIRRVLPGLESSLPPTLVQNIVYDSTKFISAALYDVIKTLIEAALIVILVIYLFLGSFRSVLIPLVTIPLSLVGVGFAMFLMGYSINLLTLLAMVLAIGLVVDDAIVVLENIYRHLEEGLPPHEAALKGAREIAVPVITMTLTLAAVFAPIGLMGGLTGALFKEFALTLAASVFVSGIVALTLSPMMCSKILKIEPKTTGNTWASRVDKYFEFLRHFYEKKLRFVLSQKSCVLVFGAVVLVSVFLLFLLTPKELAPKEDQGFLLAINSGPSYANLNYLEKYSSQIDAIFKSYPERASHFIISGRGNESDGFAGIILKPWEERKRSTQKLQPLIQDQLNSIAGIKSFLISLPDLPTGSDGLPVQFVLKSTADYRTMNTIAEQFLAEVHKSGLFIVADSDLKFDTPELNIKIDTPKAAELNISMSNIGNTLSTLLGGNYTNFFSMDGHSYKVIAQLPNQDRQNTENLQKIMVRSSAGVSTPLINFLSFESRAQPKALNQFQQLNSVTISGLMVPGQTQGSCLAFLEKTAQKILPKDFSYDYSGDSRVFKKEGYALVVTFLFALIVIFLVLAAQFESFRDPLVILVSVPMAICGALIPLNLGIATINIYTEIGLVTLVGLITKHGILMVEFANNLQHKERCDVLQSIITAAVTRLRPILMTTAAMVVGVLPLLVASGAGAQSRRDIGLVIAAGLLVGTLFTLFVVPTMYTILTKPKGQKTPL